MKFELDTRVQLRLISVIITQWSRMIEEYSDNRYTCGDLYNALCLVRMERGLCWYTTHLSRSLTGNDYYNLIILSKLFSEYKRKYDDLAATTPHLVMSFFTAMNFNSRKEYMLRMLDIRLMVLCDIQYDLKIQLNDTSVQHSRRNSA